MRIQVREREKRKVMQQLLDCVIVGGGVSGLYAAWKVIRGRPGARVLLLEKNRDRLGGRLWNVPFGFSKEESWVTLGGGVPRSTDARIRKLAQELGLEVRFFPSSKRLWVAENGQTKEVSAEMADFVERLRTFVDGNRKSLSETPLSFVQLLDRVFSADDAKRVRDWWGFRDADGEDAQAVLDGYGLSDVVGTTSYGTFGVRGYQTLVDALASALKKEPGFRVEMGAEVVGVVSCDGGRYVRVEWRNSLSSTLDSRENEGDDSTASYRATYSAPAKVAIWCTDSNALSKLRLRDPEEDERRSKLADSSVGVPFVRLWASFSSPEATRYLEVDGERPMIRTGGLLGNSFAGDVSSSDGFSKPSMIAYVGGLEEPSRWNGLANFAATETPLRLVPKQPEYERVWNAYVTAAKSAFGSEAANVPPEEMLLVAWPSGVHFWKSDGPLPGYRLASDEDFRKRSRTFLNGRLRVAGEAFASSHGWVEDALQSVDEILGQ